MKVDLIIYPSSYFNKSIVDENLQDEYEAAKATRLFSIALFDYDKLVVDGSLNIINKPSEKRRGIYRGWMMKPEEYEMFYEQLKKNNIELVTSPDEYQKMHIFPNVYSVFGSDTARMVMFPLEEKIDIEIIRNVFDRFMVKDFVKSVKGYDFPKFFNSSIVQEEFDYWIDKFKNYRGKLLTGGICIKEFFDLKRYDGFVNEYRVFYMNNNIVSVSPNSGQPYYAEVVPEKLVNKYRHLESKYYTVDFAELENGEWKVIEAGDGSVSGLSQGQNREAYYRALYNCCNL